MPACARFGLGVIPYFPLASGLLTGKVRRGEQPPEHSRLSADHFAHVLHDDNFDKLDRLEGWGKEHGRTLTEVSAVVARESTDRVVGDRGRDVAGAGAPRTPRRRAPISAPDDVEEVGRLVAA